MLDGTREPCYELVLGQAGYVDITGHIVRYHASCRFEDQEVNICTQLGIRNQHTENDESPKIGMQDLSYLI